ncbi:hypothetical protein [Kocuria rosea]|uniref:hypothetical protein n=1 Tax=Kocuria rosea TaxID=1275 RepID=UPI00203C24F4|nr:hypothetical protein [Kocuria rosea]
MNRIDSAFLSRYLHSTRSVLDATGTDCPPLETIAASWSAYQEVDRNLAPLVAEAVLSNSKDLQTFHVLALAAANAGTVQDATVRNAVADVIYAEAYKAYSEVAAEVYEAAAATFNDAATKFTKAATTVDPETDAGAVVKMTQKDRVAWLEAQQHAATLDQSLTVLTDAANLAGWAGATPDRVIPLATNPGDAHRRRVYEAFSKTDGTCRRWSALLALGVEIIAPTDLDDIHPYRAPRPTEIKQVHNGYGIRQVEWDPEDPENLDQPQPAKRGTRVVVN